MSIQCSQNEVHFHIKYIVCIFQSVMCLSYKSIIETFIKVFFLILTFMVIIFSHRKGYCIDSVLEFNTQTWLYLFSWGVDFFQHISATKFSSRGVWLLSECDSTTQANFLYGHICHDCTHMPTSRCFWKIFKKKYKN